MGAGKCGEEDKVVQEEEVGCEFDVGSEGSL
jgi:hypothetical protein